MTSPKYTNATIYGRILLALLRKDLDPNELRHKLSRMQQVRVVNGENRWSAGRLHTTAQVFSAIQALIRARLIQPAACTTSEGFKEFENSVLARGLDFLNSKKLDPTKYTMTPKGYVLATLIQLELLALTSANTVLKKVIGRARKDAANLLDPQNEPVIKVLPKKPRKASKA